MLTIRLQRMGKKKFATYRLVISEKSRDTQGDNLEILGTHNPHNKENGLVLKEERIKYWISKGAQTSNTVNNLLVKAGVIEGVKKKSVLISKKRVKKIEEKASKLAGSSKKEEQAVVVEDKAPEPVSEEPVKVEEKAEEVPVEEKKEEVTPEVVEEIKSEEDK